VLSKRVMKRLLAFSLFTLILSPAPALANAGTLNVVATFSILGDLAKQIGGDLIEVKTLVGPDNDVHSYKPTPNDLKILASADLVIENGLGFEDWINRLVSASGYKGPIVIASEGIHPIQKNARNKKYVDPHAWQNVSNTRVYARNVAAALCQSLPEKASVFSSNLKTYDALLERLDAWTKAEIGQIPVTHRKIITSHDSFGYFTEAYGVTFTSPQGMNTEVEPTAAQSAQLIEQMKAEKVKRVFIEKMVSPKLLSQLAKDAGAILGKPIYSDALSRADGPAKTYVDMFRFNVEQFKEAMLLNGG
jgi:zinc/manganese transport system substrate-binding protein